MFAYCDKCGYDSGDKSTMEELKTKVEADGGKLIYGESVCPVCKEVDSLGID